MVEKIDFLRERDVKSLIEKLKIEVNNGDAIECFYLARDLYNTLLTVLSGHYSKTKDLAGLARLREIASVALITENQLKELSNKIINGKNG